MALKLDAELKQLDVETALSSDVLAWCCRPARKYGSSRGGAVLVLFRPHDAQQSQGLDTREGCDWSQKYLSLSVIGGSI